MKEVNMKNFDMKKFGFTLAEVMVALALIGTITSLTIPTFVNANKNRTHSAKIASTVSAVENAFSSMIAIEAVQNLNETRFVQNGTYSAADLGQYIKLTGSGNSVTNYYTTDTPFKVPNGEGLGTDENPYARGVGAIFELKNGALLLFEPVPAHPNLTSAITRNAGGTVESSIGRLTIDVNGANPPNILGRDAFYFRVGTDGFLYPAGSVNFSLLEDASDSYTWNKADSKYICTDTDKGLGCTARLMENNYEVDY